MTVDSSVSGKYDLLLKGGHVIDPANKIDGKMDVAIKDRRIKQVALDIPTEKATKFADVSGYYVVPGLIDIHTHVYRFQSNDGYIEGMVPDAHLLSSGVTTTVDAGTAGWRHFVDFKERFIDPARTRILAYINIASGGMVLQSTEQNPKEFHPDITAGIAEAYPDIIVGIKAAHYWVSQDWDSEHPPWASIDKALEAGDLCGKPIMVDFWPRDPERPYQDLILKKLRPGDIHTHIFGRPFPIVDNEGKVYDYMFEAKDKGIIFDLGHGAGSFWFRNAVPAINGGFYPDSISTDLHMGNINGPVVNMLNVMSKCLSIGMSLQEVIMRSTVTPAQEISRHDLGTLSVGREADVAVLKHIKGKFGFTDCGGTKMIGDQKLECAMTIRAGNVVYDPTGLSMPEWKNAPIRISLSVSSETK
ncbi:MAG: amidohydrolase/deacetylase family metallohydrolase [Candidatus Poribacteria bacterium]